MNIVVFRSLYLWKKNNWKEGYRGCQRIRGFGYAFTKALADAGAVIGILGGNIPAVGQLLAAKNLLLEKYGKIDGLVNGAGQNCGAWKWE